MNAVVFLLHHKIIFFRHRQTISCQKMQASILKWRIDSSLIACVVYYAQGADQAAENWDILKL